MQDTSGSKLRHIQLTHLNKKAVAAPNLLHPHISLKENLEKTEPDLPIYPLPNILQ